MDSDSLGIVFPKGAEKAAERRTSDCHHPPVAELTQLYCRDCRVFINRQKLQMWEPEDKSEFSSELINEKDTTQHA